MQVVRKRFEPHYCQPWGATYAPTWSLQCPCIWNEWNQQLMCQTYMCCWVSNNLPCFLAVSIVQHRYITPNHLYGQREVPSSPTNAHCSRARTISQAFKVVAHPTSYVKLSMFTYRLLEVNSLEGICTFGDISNHAKFFLSITLAIPWGVIERV